MLKPGGERRRAARGVTLVEALIALLVLSFGVLGMAALQGRAVQQAIDAEDRHRAASLAAEIVSAMWLQGSTSLPAATVTAWQARVTDPTASGLPHASGTLGAPDAQGAVTVTIRWRPASRPQTQGDLNYTTRVVVP